MERSYLICALAGFFIAKHPTYDGADIRILIDQYLANSKFTSLGTEDSDEQLLEEATSEIFMATVGLGHNRADRRRRK